LFGAALALTMSAQSSVAGLVGKSIEAKFSAAFNACDQRNGKCYPSPRRSFHMRVYISSDNKIFDYAKGKSKVGDVYVLGRRTDGVVWRVSGNKLYFESGPGHIRVRITFTASGNRCRISYGPASDNDPNYRHKSQFSPGPCNVYDGNIFAN